MSTLNCSPTALHYSSFAIVVADRTLCGRAYATVLRLEGEVVGGQRWYH